jgi:hypothetical protein
MYEMPTIAEPRTKRSYESIVDEHRELERQSAELSAFLQQARPEPGSDEAHDWAEELGRRLVALHDKLSTHFRAEETAGLFQDLAATFPQSTGKVKELEAQHRAVLRELRSVLPEALRFAGARPDAGPGLRRRTQALLDLLAEHEAAETELIQRLYLEDLGPAD